MSMKYLFNVIDSVAEEQSRLPKSARRFDTRQLIDLVSEAKEGHDDKNHTQEFYDTLERIVNELRGWTEHSAAFLQRVRKSEVIDYYDVIKNPMDLGTVLKKVKTQQYKSKKEFNDDLELIWHNCWTYNSAPNHPLRRSASLLQQKAHQLLQFVSDLTPSQNTQRSHHLHELDDEPGSRSRTGSLHPNRSVSPATSEWRKSTTPRLMSVPFPERPALSRSPSNMAQFQQIINTPPQESDSTPSTSKVTLEQWYDVLQKDQFFAAGVPSIPVVQDVNYEQTHQEQNDKKPTKKKYKRKSKIMKQGLGSKIQTNLTTLREIRRLHKDIAKEYQAMNTPQDSDSVHLLNEPSEDDSEPPPTKRKNVFEPLPKAIFNTSQASDAGLENLRQISGTLAEHAGFESSTATALNVLAGLAAEHIMNSGRMIRFFCDRFADMFTADEIINHVLDMNGTRFPLELESYIKDDIERHGSRLSDLLGKLKQVRQERLDGDESKAVDDEDMFAKDGEAMMLGGFSGALGDDFFGLRELGLDKELGVESLSIPRRLFFGDTKIDKPDVLSRSPSRNRTSLPPTFVPLDEKCIDQQIGLLQPFFKARAATEVRMTDDDRLPIKPKVYRPKVPPIGKIPVKRRAIEPPPGVPKKRIGRPPKVRDANNNIIQKPKADVSSSASSSAAPVSANVTAPAATTTTTST